MVTQLPTVSSGVVIINNLYAVSSYSSAPLQQWMVDDLISFKEVPSGAELRVYA